MLEVLERHSLTAEPEVAVSVVRAVLVECARQARDMQLDDRRVHVVSLVVSTSNVHLRVRAFGPKSSRELKFRDAAALFRAVASRALEDG